MKKFGRSLPVVLAVLLSVFAGCGRKSLDLQGNVYDVRFVLNSGGAGETRSTTVVDETYLREWCLYVVDMAGKVQDAVSASSPYALRNLPEGTYVAYAVVNCGMEEDSFEMADEIMASRHNLSDEKDAFSMYGSSSFKVPEDTLCTIPVQRLVSKVEIRKVRTDFSQYPDLAVQPFTLDRIYLINVAAESMLADSPTFSPEMWYNKRDYASCEVDELIYDAVGRPITEESPYSTPHYFYCYQNNSVSDSHAPT